MLLWAVIVYAQGIIALLEPADMEDEDLKTFCALSLYPDLLLSHLDAKNYLQELIDPLQKPADGVKPSFFQKYKFPIEIWYKKNRGNHHWDLSDILGINRCKRLGLA